LNPQLLAHVGQQTGAKFFLKILHNRVSLTEIKCTEAPDAALGIPAVSE
jgi:hypothetical protein